MKRIILFLLIICSFSLVGCNKTPSDNIKTEANLTDTVKDNEPSNTNDDSNQDENTNDLSQTSDTDQSLPDYDDGTVWKGTIF